MSAQSSEKEQGWLLPDRTKDEMKAGLYIVATPIGNMGDISLRALDTLQACDVVVCEDTRVTGKLLSYYGLDKKLLPYNDHNAAKQRGPIMEKITGGGKVALVSDAGMPLISDPGYKLIRDCEDLGIPVTSLPGANAPLTALQLSGMPSDRFCFLGFLPPKTAGRIKTLEEWVDVNAPLIAFETAPRLQAALADILEVMGEREVAVTRELTKMYEEVRRAPVSELIRIYDEEGPPRGEIVLVIGPPAPREWTEEEIDNALRKALEDMSTKDAAAQVAELSGKSKKDLYARALELSP